MTKQKKSKTHISEEEFKEWLRARRRQNPSFMLQLFKFIGALIGYLFALAVMTAITSWILYFAIKGVLALISLM